MSRALPPRSIEGKLVDMHFSRIGRGVVLASFATLFGATSCNLILGITPGTSGDGGTTTAGGTAGTGGTSATTGGTGGTTASGGTTTTGGSSGSTMTGGTAGTTTTGMAGSGACAEFPAPDGDATNWSKHPTGNYEEDGQAISVLSSGDVLVAGYYSYSDFTVESVNHLPYPDHDAGPGEKQNIFVARYSKSGVPQKSYGVVGEDSQYVTSMAVDPSGNAVVGGYLLGTMDVGGNSFISDQQYTPIAVDGFVFKVDSNLNPLWAKQYGGAGSEEVRAVATDSQGNVIVLGVSVYAGSDYDAAPAQLPTGFGCPGMNEMLNKAEDRMYLMKLDPNGNCTWGQTYVVDTRYYGLYGMPEGLAMTVDKDDNIVVAGAFAGTANFGGGYTLNAADGKDIFILKTDPAGVPLWAENYGGTAYQVANAVATDAAGDIWIGGHWQVGIKLSDSLQAIDGNLDMDYRKGFVAKFALDAMPNVPAFPVALQAFNDIGAIDVRGLSVTPDGDVAIGGTLYPQQGSVGVDFGDGKKEAPAGKDPDGNQNNDAFLAKYCKDGGLRWSHRYQTTGGEVIEAVATDADGHTFATGEFDTPYGFGAAQTMTPLGWDAFVFRVGP